jgi:hypothetical protein
MSQDRRTAPAPAAGAAESPPLARWAPCPTCWGQRQIWEPEEASNGEGRVLVPHACPDCLGIGEVVR